MKENTKYTTELICRHDVLYHYFLEWKGYMTVNEAIEEIKPIVDLAVTVLLTDDFNKVSIYIYKYINQKINHENE
jgi:hypothetical protein